MKNFYKKFIGFSAKHTYFMVIYLEVVLEIKELAQHDCNKTDHHKICVFSRKTDEFFIEIFQKDLLFLLLSVKRSFGF